MNLGPGHDRHDEELPDEGLDQLLRQARWPAIPEESSARLRRTWRGVWPAERKGRGRAIGIAAAAVAAVILIAIGFVQWLRRDSVHVVTPEVVRVVPPVEEKPRRDAYVRSATPLEAAMMRRELAAQVRPDARARAGQRIGDALERLANAPAQGPADVAALAGELRRHVDQRFLEDRLTAVAAEGSLERRRAALRLLSATGTGRALPALLEGYRSAELRRAAAEGVARLADAEALARLALEAEDGAVQGEMLAQLLQRPAGSAAPLVLGLMQDPRTAEALTGALRAVAADAALADALFRHLRAPRAHDRLAAARALAAINGPETTRRLIALAHADVTRREALYALLRCGGTEAAAFLAEAEHDPTLSSVLRLLRRPAGGPPGDAT